MKNKKGYDVYSILLPLLIGLIVLFIVFYFFQESFGSDDINIEVCKQSVLARANLPEVNKAGFTLGSFKDNYPLKCETQIVKIDFKDNDALAQQIVAENIAGCWALYGRGNYDIFRSSWFGFKSTCTPCAVIQIDSSVKDYYVTHPIDITNGLNRKFEAGTYLSYLDSEGESPFPALSIAGSRMFDLNSEFFEVLDSDSFETRTFKNRMTGKTEKGSIAKINLPKFFNPKYGDLVIVFGITTSSQTSGIGNYIPYLFYYQSSSPKKPISQTKKSFIDGTWLSNAELCNQWDGVGAASSS